MLENEMWQRFTVSTTVVIHFSQDEAGRTGKNAVGTEDILIGLLREEKGAAVHILNRMGVSLNRLRTEIAAKNKNKRPERKNITRDNLALSTNLKIAFEDAVLAANELNSKQNHLNFVDTEHILLGILAGD